MKDLVTAPRIMGVKQFAQRNQRDFIAQMNRDYLEGRFRQTHRLKVIGSMKRSALEGLATMTDNARKILECYRS